MSQAASNFAIQSGNGLINASRLEDFKVFLHNDVFSNTTVEAAKMKVINAWKGRVLNDQNVLSKFEDYFISLYGDETIQITSEIEALNYLNNSNEWFDDIFSKIIEP